MGTAMSMTRFALAAMAVLLIASAVASYDDVVEEDDNDGTAMAGRLLDMAKVQRPSPLDAKKATKALAINARHALVGEHQSQRAKAEDAWANKLGDMLEQRQREKNAPRELMHKTLEKASIPKKAPEPKDEDQDEDDDEGKDFNDRVEDAMGMDDMLLQVPEYLTTEEDLDAFLAQKGRKQIIHNMGVPENQLSEADKAELRDLGMHEKDGRGDKWSHEKTVEHRVDQMADPEMLLQIPKYITSEDDLDAYLKQQGVQQVQHNQGVPEDELSDADRQDLHDVIDKKAPEASLLQIPKYITSEDALDAYLKQQGVKTVEHNQGVPENEMSDEDRADLHQVIDKTPEASLLQIPKYITSEEDLDAYLAQQGTKVVHHSMGMKESELSAEDKADLDEALKPDEEKPWDHALKIDSVVPEVEDLPIIL